MKIKLEVDDKKVKESLEELEKKLEIILNEFIEKIKEATDVNNNTSDDN